MQWPDLLRQILKIQYPIIQAPMLGVSTPQMVAAISNAGGLGSLAVGGLSPDKTAELIQKTKTLTNKPFAVNLFAHSIPLFDIKQTEEMQYFLLKLSADNNIVFQKQDIASLQFYSYKEQTEILISEKIPVVSFTFGNLDAESVDALHAYGAILTGTATSVKEAEILDRAGVDLITAQGIEAGGHRGSFIEEDPLPQLGLFSLIPQIITHCKAPVIAAGGVNNGRTIKAAFNLGAVGVQIGTAFIASNESSAIPAYKEAVQNAADTATELTRTFSGRWARSIRNRFMEEVETSGLSIPPYPIQNSLTAQLRAVAQKQDNKDFTNLWAGQSANGAKSGPAADIFNAMVNDYLSI